MLRVHSSLGEGRSAISMLSYNTQTDPIPGFVFTRCVLTAFTPLFPVGRSAELAWVSVGGSTLQSQHLAPSGGGAPTTPHWRHSLAGWSSSSSTAGRQKGQLQMTLAARTMITMMVMVMAVAVTAVAAAALQEATARGAAESNPASAAT